MKNYKRLEHVEAGWRFIWAPQSSFIAVRLADALTTDTPYDMDKLPDWVSAANMDDDAFRTLCRRWIHNETAPTAETRNHLRSTA